MSEYDDIVDALNHIAGVLEKISNQQQERKYTRADMRAAFLLGKNDGWSINFEELVKTRGDNHS